MVMGVGHSIAFHIDAIGEDQSENAGSREGIWWLPNGTANDYLVLTNQGQNPLQLALFLFDASGKASVQNLTLPPRGMTRASVRQLVATAKLAGSYGGIKVSAASHAGSLDSLHVLFDQNGGFSAVMKMFDYDPRAQIKERDFAGTGQWTLRAPMLALASPDPALAFPVGTKLQPQIFVHNTTSKPVDAALTFNWRSDATSDKALGPALHLLPFETRRIDVAALQDGKTLPQNAQWASVTLATSGLPDEVVAVAASYDGSLHYGAQTPFSDQLAGLWKGSQWQYDPQHDSIITVGNGGAKTTLAAFTIFYNQGTQKYEIDQTLQPGQQMWMDIGKLIRENVPDKNGKTLPADLTSGSYEVRDLTNKAVGTLFEGKVIYDKTYGHVTYGCGGCCGHIPPINPWYNPVEMLIAAEQDDGVWAWSSCESEFDDVSPVFYGNWSSGDTSIVTVDTYGTHRGIAVGSTTSETFGLLPSNGPRTCVNEHRYPSGGANVVPTISGPNTLWWFSGLGSGVSGYSTQVTLTANSGGSGTTYQWAITAGSTKVTLSTSTSATVQVTSIGQSTSANDVSVTVTVGGQTSSPFKLTVRAPYAFGTDPSHPTPVYGTDATYVWNIYIPYLILDNFLSPMPSPIEVNENWTTGVVSDYPTGENWAQSTPGCNSTLSNEPASITDFIEGDFPFSTPTPVYNVNQNGPAVLHWGQEFHIGTCTIGGGPRVQTDTFQKYTDHASHTGITSPAS